MSGSLNMRSEFRQIRRAILFGLLVFSCGGKTMSDEPAKMVRAAGS
jgi:hypothetical protein